MQYVYCGVHLQTVFESILPPQNRFAPAFAKVKSSSISQLVHLFGSFVGPALDFKNPSGSNSRHRIFTTSLIFWGFLSQVLSPGSSCREALSKIAAFLSGDQQRLIESDTSAYCQARSRLPLEILEQVDTRVVMKLAQLATDQTLWCGRSVKVIDGSTLSMPDTPSNQERWPQPASQKKGCGFPLMRIVGLFCLQTGALLKCVNDTFFSNENNLLPRLLDCLVAGDVLLGDRAYSSYSNIAKLLKMGVDSVFRLHQSRPADFRSGKPLGKDDRLIVLVKPKKRPRTMTKEEFDALPATLSLRMMRIQIKTQGFRSTSVIVITTLLDPKVYPKNAVLGLYLRRWNVELFLRHIKTTMKMDVLRCKSPNMIEKELLMHAITYNLVRHLMLQTSEQFGVPLDRISFRGTLDAIRQWTPLIAAAPSARKRTELIDAMLRLIAKDRVPCRPGRREPRAVKRRPKAFQLLSRPRSVMKETPHRSKFYGKKRRSALP